MDPLVIFAIVMVFFTIVLFLECPIAFALALTGFLGIVLSDRSSAASSALGAIPFTSTAVYGLAVVPLYVLMGMFAFHAKIPQQLYEVAARLLHRVPGGLAIATVAACAGFSSVSGSSVATAATMARVSADEMRARGYPDRFATGLIAAGGGLGMVIPPSTVLVIYAFITGESIARVLISGVVPGIMLATVYMAYSLWRGRHMAPRPLAYAGASHAEAIPRDFSEASTAEGVRASAPPLEGGRPGSSRLRDLPLGGVLGAVTIFGVVILGIQGGLVTVTESGALAVIVAFVMVVIMRRGEGGRATLSVVRDSLSQAASTTTMAMSVLVGASIFSFYLVSSRLPARLTEWLTGLAVPSWFVVAAMLFCLIPLGMFLESLSCILIMVPLTYPVVTALGYDGVWYGVLVILLVEMGMLTPPVGLNVFVVADTVKDVSVGEVFKGVAPFLVLTLGVVVLLFIFPEIALWLPDLLTS